jgi:glycosyltransferase involved in cell wall biosynthesis
MSEHTTVSVITPCYNGAKYLRETIESVLAQTHPVLEMIVIDDGSTDDSAAIAKLFGQPVRVIRQTNQGESVARNRGVAEAKGEYLLFLDADDLLDPGSLQQLTDAALQLPGTVVAQGCLRFTDHPGHSLSITPAQWPAFFPAVLGTNLGPPHVCLYPAPLVRKVGGYNASLQWSEDWDFVAQIALTGAPLVNIELNGAWYRQHAQSQLATMKVANRARGHAAVIGRLGKGMLARPDLLNDHGDSLFWAAWTAVRRAREKGVQWQELADVAHVLTDLVRLGPPQVRSTRLAVMIRTFGVRWASRMYGLVNRQSTWSKQAAAV